MIIRIFGYDIVCGKRSRKCYGFIKIVCGLKIIYYKLVKNIFICWFIRVIGVKCLGLGGFFYSMLDLDFVIRVCRSVDVAVGVVSGRKVGCVFCVARIFRVVVFYFGLACGVFRAWLISIVFFRRL